MKNIFLSVFFLVITAIIPSLVAGGTLLRMQTDLGGVDIELFDIATPQTVDNFMFYINGGVNGDGYDGTFIHRSTTIDDTGLAVLQMGGWIFNPANGSFINNDGINHILVGPPVVNEPGISNTRGTFAMAKLAGDPDSATSEFFFNLVDNINLDTLESGFTVFGEVLGNGMAVIDAIADLERCKDISFILPSPCTNFPQVPLVAIETVAGLGGIFTTPILQQNLVNVLHIGIDTDGDGIIDRVEDAAPNNGDMNNDFITDSGQTHVASFQTLTGDFVVIEIPSGFDFRSTDILGQTFANTTIDPFGPNNELANLLILQGFFATEISGISNGATITLTLTLPATDNPNGFFIFGPEPGNLTPHWYEFDFDGETGAHFNGAVVTLNFVDGKRGDADLQLNGKIIVPPGGAVIKAPDSDGIHASIEDQAPNNGDGNNDGILDSTQDNVVSLTDLNGRYVTLEVDPSLSLRSIQFFRGDIFLVQNPPLPELSGLNFTHGFLAFSVIDVTPGTAVEVNVILPEGELPITYYKYGQTPDNPVDHLYEFIFDGETGAEFNGNVITLHFVDGKRGDFDLTANGVIIDLGAPALEAKISSASSSGGGGCTLAKEGSGPTQAGAWWMLLALICLHGSQRAYKRMPQ